MSEALVTADVFKQLEEAHKHDPNLMRQVKALIEGPAGQAFEAAIQAKSGEFYYNARKGSTDSLDGIPMDRDAWLGAVTGLQHAGTIWRAIFAKVKHLSGE